jgi:diguanylate cyclase (GGDEF)-like protein
MKHVEAFSEIKRVIYLWTIPFILLLIITYFVIEPNDNNNLINILIVKVIMGWYIFSWFFLFKKKLYRMIEFVTLGILTFSHIYSFYDTLVHYIIMNVDNAIGMYVIWVPLLILIFFLILGSKIGLIYSLSVFSILLALGISYFKLIPEEFSLPIFQFYLAYLTYILTFYFGLRLIKLLVEIDHIKKNAYTDYLTGIGNRIQIDIWLENEFELSRKQQSLLSVLFFDIDHFKDINDTFGHKVGDSVLKEFANLIKSHLSDEDKFGRWGGEEFLIIRRQSKQEAGKLAEMLRKEIEQYDLEYAGKQSASFGVTQYIQGETVDELLSRVDKGLYESKQSGRNKVTLV